MTYSMWGMIAATPWWEYLLITGCFSMAWQLTKPQWVRMRQAVGFQAIGNLCLITLVFYFYPLDWQKTFILLSAIFPGIFLGFLQFSLRRIKAVKNPALFYLPGSWGMMILLCVGLVARFYYFNINLADYYFIFQNPGTLKESAIPAMIVGLSVGLFIGRMSYLHRCLKHAIAQQ